MAMLLVLPHRHTLTLLLLLLLFLPHTTLSVPDLDSERAALLALRSTVGGRTLFWNATNNSPCDWAGVQCHHDHVVELHLPAVALSGQLPLGIFGNLTHLRTLSLRFNALTGTLPSDLASCLDLRNLYLQGNLFSGQIPPFLFRLPELVRLNMASNNFSGDFPAAFDGLVRLKTLFLQDNQLSGPIPDLNHLDLDQFNVSNNRLNGSVPLKLQRFTSDSFLGNSLCGKPLSLCPGTDNAAAGGNELSGGAIAGIVIGSVVGLLLLAFLLMFLCRNKSSNKTSTVDVATVKHPESEVPAEKSLHDVENGIGNGNVNGNGYSAAAATINKVEANGVGAKKLVFFGNSARGFDLEDLLRASAEVLGKGTFGTAYKAVLETGLVVAVKRLKDVTISEKEFKDKIETVGAMDHQSLVPLRAYYFSRDEKLLVYDYMPMGSLSALLHGQLFNSFLFFTLFLSFLIFFNLVHKLFLLIVLQLHLTIEGVACFRN